MGRSVLIPVLVLFCCVEEPPARVAGRPVEHPAAKSQKSPIVRAPRQQLQHLYDAGEHRQALELGEQILRKRPDDQMVLQIVAMCHCRLKDAAQARVFHARLRPVLRSLVQRICKQNEISLE